MKGWAPEKIVAALVLRKKSQVQIARKLGVGRSCVNKVINNKTVSRRIRKAIAREVGAKVTEIWPAA